MWIEELKNLVHSDRQLICIYKYYRGLITLWFYMQAESAIVALNCSGMVLGTQPVR